LLYKKIIKFFQGSAGPWLASIFIILKLKNKKITKNRFLELRDDPSFSRYNIFHFSSSGHFEHAAIV